MAEAGEGEDFKKKKVRVWGNTEGFTSPPPFPALGASSEANL